MTKGPLQLLMEQEEARAQQIKEMGEKSVAAGYEKRHSVPDESLKAAVARRNSVNKVKQALQPRRASHDCTPSAGPTAAALMRLARRKQLPPPPQEETPPPLTAEEKQEIRLKQWDFHRRSELFLEEKDKFLEAQRLRQAKEAMRECTFTPRKTAASPRCTTPRGETMLERTQRMEARKQEKLNKLRQEKFDKEMANCSFHPSIHRDVDLEARARARSCERGDSNYGTPSPYRGNPYRRSSGVSSCTSTTFASPRSPRASSSGPGGGRQHRWSYMHSPASMAFSPGFPSASPGYPSGSPGYFSGSPGFQPGSPGYPSASTGFRSAPSGYGQATGQYSSEASGSEYFDGGSMGDHDEVSSMVSDAPKEGYDAQDITIKLSPGFEGAEASNSRIPRVPIDVHAATEAANLAKQKAAAAAQAAFDARQREQAEEMQRIEERKQLLEETMTPTSTNFAASPSPGAASFAAAFEQKRKKNSAAVSSALDRMESLLTEDVNLMFEESDDEWINEELGESKDIISLGAPILDRKARQAPLSPMRGGA